MKRPRGVWKSGHTGLSLVGISAVLTVTVAGCVGVPGTDDGDAGADGGSGTTGSPNAQIIVPANFGLSGSAPPVSIVYTVPETATDVRAFAVPVENGGADAAQRGDAQLLATGLAAGGGQAFTFNPSEVADGYYRIRLSFIFDGVEEFAESVSAIEVQGPPAPVFIRPAVSVLRVVQGEEVSISFDAGDPQNEVQWRLFFLRENDPRDAISSALGVELTTGTGNAGIFTWPTSSVAPGEYELGVSATDSGSSVASTASAGEFNRIITIPSDDSPTPRVEIISQDVSQFPFVQITSPGSSDVRVFQDEDFTIEWNATVFAEGAEGLVEVFYDTDKNVDNGFVSIVKDRPTSVKSVRFPSGVEAGEYFIGATIRDGVNPPQTAYSEGTLEVVRGVFVRITSPDASLPVPPGTDVSVAWTTNAPQTAGTLEVVYQSIFKDGATELPFGEEKEVLTTTDLSTRSAKFTSGESGLFRVSVRMTLVDGTIVAADAPQLVQFSTLPGIIYLGSLADTCTNDPQDLTLPRCAGAIFGGVNFEDNAGASLTAAGDLNGDGLGEFVIASRYGKPFFLNPQGIGPGEAYIIYGRSGINRIVGEFNLNTVGTSALTGVTLTGIQTAATCQVSGNPCESNADCPPNERCLTPVDSNGLTDVTLLPDVDGDGSGELSFGFPRTDSLIEFPMATTGQFLAGGVVFLSSNNTILRNPEVGTPVIGLSRVGRSFFVSECAGGNNDGEPCEEDEECGTDGLCVFRSARPSVKLDDGTWVPVGDDDALDLILDDQRNFNGDVCEDGTDNELDTIIGPSLGFGDAIAIPAWAQIGFEIVTGGEGPGQCMTQFDLANCDEQLNSGPFSQEDSGSGFYPTGAIPVEPFGARILGRGAGGAFGTSIAVLTSAEGSSSAELLVAAPFQTIRPNLPSSGVAHLFGHRNLWDSPASNLPTPHQYVIDRKGFCGDGRFAGPGVTIALGDANDEIENVLGIGDFNDDGRNDFVVGAPNANGGGGRLYVAFRREELEGEFRLDELALSPISPSRLDGFLLRSDRIASLGSSLASGFDFNGDGVEDLVAGSPNADQNVGEVIVVFGQQGTVSPENGYEVERYLTEIRNAAGRPVAARITGRTLGGVPGQFGFNVANGGDLDGDGVDDLLVAAPDAEPFFDPNPSDEIDELIEPGIDLDRDGRADEIAGKPGERLTAAGLVYVISGRNRLDNIKECSSSETACSSNADCAAGESCIWTDVTIDIDELGSGRLRGFIIVGRRAGDRLGGGDAGNSQAGGIQEKADRGRSRGLASAGDVDGDGRDDILIGSILADPRRDPTTDVGITNGGEVYLIYGSNAPEAGGQ